MTKAEAQALFERIFKQLSDMLHPVTIHLIYTQLPGLRGKRTWHILIDNGSSHNSRIKNEEDWKAYKIVHHVLETDQDLEDYAEIVRMRAKWDEGMI